MEASDGLAVVHGVEGRDLVDAHGGHLEQPGDLVHDADAREAVLALAQVEERHHGRFLVLRRVPLEDLGDELLVDRVESERDRRVVLWAVSVLKEEKKTLSAVGEMIFFKETTRTGGRNVQLAGLHFWSRRWR